jgi:hypothetical protein
MCAKELSVLFAHIVKQSGANDDTYSTGTYKESVFNELELNSSRSFSDYNQTELSIPKWRQGFFFLTEENCREDSPLGCAYRECKLFDCNENKKYFGRGTSKIFYNQNYISFSKKLYGEQNKLINRPKLVAEDGRVAILTALYKYMVQTSQKPSAHLVTTGGWIPNANDIKNNRLKGFGTTLDTIAGETQCGHSIETSDAQDKIEYYKKFREFFNIPILDLYNNNTNIDGLDNIVDTNSTYDANEKLGCSKIKNVYHGGYSDIPRYWDRHWSEPGRCRLVKYPTPFSAMNIGTYKECVKSHFFN